MQSCQAQVLLEHLRIRWVPTARGMSHLCWSVLLDQLSSGIPSLGGKHWQLQALRGFQGCHHCPGEEKTMSNNRSDPYTLDAAQETELKSAKAWLSGSLGATPSRAAPTSFSNRSPPAMCQHRWPWKLLLREERGTCAQYQTQIMTVWKWCGGTSQGNQTHLHMLKRLLIPYAGRHKSLGESKLS